MVGGVEIPRSQRNPSAAGGQSATPTVVTGGARPLHLTPSAVAQVMLGGVGGAAAREALEQVLPAGKGFPTATLVANLTGAFLLGVILEALVRAGDDTGWRRRGRLVAGTGFMGAYTTYSTFAVEADELVRHGRVLLAVVYVAVTVIGGLVVAGAGIALAGALSRRRPVDVLPVDPDVDREDPV